MLSVYCLGFFCGLVYLGDNILEGLLWVGQVLKKKVFVLLHGEVSY